MQKKLNQLQYFKIAALSVLPLLSTMANARAVVTECQCNVVGSGDVGASCYYADGNMQVEQCSNGSLLMGSGSGGYCEEELDENDPGATWGNAGCMMSCVEFYCS